MKYPITDIFTVLVDETKTVENLFLEGKFKSGSWSSAFNSKNFPCPSDGGISEKEVVLFHFEKDMTSDEVIAEMDKHYCRPATIQEFLSLVVAQPNIHKLGFSIITLGSRSLAPEKTFPFFNENWEGCRSLFQASAPVWYDKYRFVGVRK
jgi:hypothetical protein